MRTNIVSLLVLCVVMVVAGVGLLSAGWTRGETATTSALRPLTSGRATS